jgi:hypothetical protein
MSAQPTSPSPVGGLDDSRALQIPTSEHWSLLSARSLAPNEASSGAGMFLTFPRQAEADRVGSGPRQARRGRRNG